MLLKGWGGVLAGYHLKCFSANLSSSLPALSLSPIFLRALTKLSQQGFLASFSHSLLCIKAE